METTTASAPSSAPAPSSSPASSSAPTSAAPVSLSGGASPAAGAGNSATPGAVAPAGSAPPIAAPRRYKVKANGADKEIDAAHVDALAEALGLDPMEILKGSAMAKSSYERWQEAAKLRKEAEEFQKAQKARYEDPRIAALKARDPSLSDEDAWAFLRVQERYEREQMNPDQRALADERQRREELERKMREQEEGTKKQQFEAKTEAEKIRIDRGLSEALQKHSLPKNPAWARAALDHMATQARAGVEPDIEAAVLHVKRIVQGDDRQRLASLSDEQLEGWIGKDIIDRILKRSVERVRGGPAPVQPPAPAPMKEPEGKPFLSEEEWRAKYR